MKFSTAVLGFWYDDRSMYLVLHKGLKFCPGAPLGIFWGAYIVGGFTIESYGEIYFLQEFFLGPIVMKLHRNDPWDV
jgi:hypothetical protein